MTQRKRLGKKGFLTEAGIEIALFYLVVGLIGALAGSILVSFRDQQTTTSISYAVADAAANGTLNFGQQFETAGTVGGMILLFLLLGFGLQFLLGRRSGGPPGGMDQY